jgi:hypothetical protein
MSPLRRIFEANGRQHHLNALVDRHADEVPVVRHLGERPAMMAAS